MNDLRTTLRPWQLREAENLAQVYQRGDLHHAIIVSGPEATGNKVFADNICHFLLCEQAGTREITGARLACGHCQACNLYAAGTHPDRYEVSVLEDKKSIAIDSVRAVQNNLLQKSQLRGNKVCLINPGEDLNSHSANALLKILEEPPANTFIIITATVLSNILPTIRSRCLQIKLGIPASAACQEWLEAEYQAPDVVNALSLSCGLPERALEILSEGEQITDYASLVSDFLLQKGACSEIAGRIEKNDMGLFLDMYIHCIHALISGAGQAFHPDLVSRYRHLPKSCFEQLLPRIFRAKAESQQNPNRRLFIEALLLDSANLLQMDLVK